MLNIEIINETILLWLVPITTGLVEVAKLTLNLKPRYLPIYSVVIGIVLSMLVAGPNAISIISGIVVGLGAVGLFEFGKNAIK